MNKEWFDTKVEPVLSQGAQGQIRVIFLSACGPDTTTMYHSAYLLPRYEQALRTYWEIPSSVVLIQASP